MTDPVEPWLLVLVADDEPLILEILEQALESGGFATVTATDGGQAQAQMSAEGRAIRALITDIRMGDGPDGWEVARRARGLNPRLPVIYMSGDSAGDWSSQGVPGSIMLQKPFAVAQVVTAVASMIHQTEV